jgi:hypothetical protein
MNDEKRADADLRGDVLQALMLDTLVPKTVHAKVDDGFVTESRRTPSEHASRWIRAESAGGTRPRPPVPLGRLISPAATAAPQVGALRRPRQPRARLRGSRTRSATAPIRSHFQ